VRRVASMVLLSLLVVSLAFAADPTFRKFIRQGMTEQEVLTKIGRPDDEVVDTGKGEGGTVKRWVYFSTPGDVGIQTTIVIQDAKVISVTRQSGH
jgi:hypothetical protein